MVPKAIKATHEFHKLAVADAAAVFSIILHYSPTCSPANGVFSNYSPGIPAGILHCSPLFSTLFFTEGPGRTWQLPGRGLAPGRGLTVAWQKPGRGVAEAWQGPGRCLARAWGLAGAWQRLGRDLARAWQGPGRIWNSLGANLNCFFY